MIESNADPEDANPEDVPQAAAPTDTGPQLIAFLEPGQLVANTTRPVPRARLGTRTRVALWVLRIFVLLVSIMVIYTFITQLL